MPELSAAANSRTDAERAFNPYASSTSPADTRSAVDSIQDFLLLGPPAAAAGFIETIGTTLGLTDEKSYREGLQKVLPTIGTFYNRNPEAAKTVGDIAGSLIPGAIGVKLLKGAGRLAEGIMKGKKAKLLSSVFIKTGKFDEELAALRARDRFLGAVGTKDFASDGLRRSLARQARTTKVTDILKENAAFEAGVAVTMNDSQTLFPDEFSALETFGLLAAFPVTFAGVGFAVVNRQIRASAALNAKVAETALDPEALLGGLISRPGVRDITATILGRTAQTSRGIKEQMILDQAGAATTKEAANASVGITNFNKQQLVLEQDMKAEIKKMGTDSTVKGITKKVDLSDSEVLTVMDAARKEPGVLLGTLSAQPLPNSQVGILQLYKDKDIIIGALNTEYDKLIADRTTLLKELGKKSVDGVIDIDNPKLVKLADDITDVQADLDEINSLQFHVIETNGDLVDARGRKPIWQDRKGPVTISQRTQNEPKIFTVTADADPIYGTNKQLIGVTEDFEILIPEAKVGTISNINITRIIPEGAVGQSEHFRFILKDMGQDWAPFESGILSKISSNRGGVIFDQLSPEVQAEVKQWVRSSNSSKIRKWFADGDPRALELFNAGEPVRQRLREIANPNGTIPLFRGEASAETKAVTNDVVSMTSNPVIVKAFAKGGNIVVRDVPVEDVIMIVGGANEFEFIVKGNTKRVIGDQVTKSSFETLTLFQRSAGYGGLQEAVNAWRPSTKINISAGSHHTKLDAFLSLYSTQGNKLLNDATLPPAFQSIDDIHFASIAGKFEEYVRIRKVTDSVRGGVLKLKDEQIINLEDIRKMLNLPGTGFEQAHPMVRAFDNLYREGKTSLVEAVQNLNGFKQLVQSADDLPPGTPFLNREIDLMGGMLHPPPKLGAGAKKLKEKTPVLLVKRPVTQEQYSRDNLSKAASIERIRVISKMANAEAGGAGLVAVLYNALLNNQAIVKAAQDVGSLATGTTRGTAAIGQLSFAGGEIPTIVAAHELEMLTDKPFRLAVKEIFERVNPTVNQLKAPKNEAHLRVSNLYIHARRQGWDVNPNFQELNEGLVGLKLKPTDKNRDRWRLLFDEEMPKDAWMPSPGTVFKGKFQNTPLGLTPLAAKYADELDELSRIVHANDSFIKDLMGRGKLAKRERWVPPRNFAGENIVYVMTPTGELIAPATGRTMAEARRNADQISEAVGGKTFAVDQSTDMERYFDIQDKAFSDMRDFSDPLLQTGAITGKQVGPNVVQIGEEAINEITRSVEKRFESILRRGRAVYFEPQIALARKRFKASGIPNPKAGTSVWQMYLASIFGNPTLNPNQMIGATYFGIEKIYDTVLNTAFDKWAAFVNPKNALKIKASRKDDKIYNQLSEQLGEFNPFADTLDMLNRTQDVKVPVNMKKHMAAVTSFTALMTLRLFEVGHSILNLTSLGATIPGVVAAMKKTSSEIADGVVGQERFLARTGLFGTQVDETTAMWSPTKAMVSGTHFMFTKEGHELWARAAKKGFLQQQVAETFSTMTAPTQGYWQNIASRSTKMASILSDKSEEIARGIAFATGYNLAKKGLNIADDNILMAFAHNFANKVIGDYSPNNKPRMFQGAVGMPLGLFTTFTWNYFQRLFGYIENQQTRAIATQFATQAGVFGAQTVPGFQLYMDTFFSNYDGTVNPVDALNKRFGPEATEIFLTGGISNIPKMFGFDDGVSLYTRGDPNVRNIPTIATATNTAVFRMGADFFSAARETLGMLRSRGGFDDDQMAEIIQQYSTNRALRNLGSLYTGFKIDRRGEVVDNPGTFKDFLMGEANNDLSIIAAFMGLNTTDQSRKAETFRRIRATDMAQRSMKRDLRSTLRAANRAGEVTPELLNEVGAKYIRNGGSPENFINWVGEQFLISQVDKTALKISEIIGNPQKSNDLLRLMSVLSPTPTSLPKIQGPQQ